MINTSIVDQIKTHLRTVICCECSHRLGKYFVERNKEVLPSGYYTCEDCVQTRTEFPSQPERAIDLRGKTFGKLTVLGVAPRKPRTEYRWFVQCVCGIVKTVFGTPLRVGDAKSCGRCSRPRKQETSPEKRAFFNARSRCNNPKNTRYADYGGRGIEFRFMDFAHFYREVGPRSSTKHSLERINNDGHYEPGNCCWATQKVQQANKGLRNVPLEKLVDELQKRGFLVYPEVPRAD